jgi:hypothetical protein
MSKIPNNNSSTQSARRTRRPARVDKVSQIPSSTYNTAAILEEANQPSVADERMLNYLQMVTDPMRAIEEGNIVGAPTSVDFSSFSTKFTTRAYNTFGGGSPTSLFEVYGSVVAPTISRGNLGQTSNAIIQSDFPNKTPYYGTNRGTGLLSTVQPIVGQWKSAPPGGGVGNVKSSGFGTSIPLPNLPACMSAGAVPVSMRGSRVRILARHYEFSFSGNAFNSSGTAYLITPKNLLSSAPTTGGFSGGSLCDVDLTEALADPGNQVTALPLTAMSNEGLVLSFTRIPTSEYELLYAQGDYSNTLGDASGAVGPDPYAVGYIEALFYVNGLIPGGNPIVPGATTYPSFNICITTVYEMVSNIVGIGSNNLSGNPMKYLATIPPTVKTAAYNDPHEISPTRALHVADAIVTHKGEGKARSLLQKAGDFIMDNVVPIVAKLGGAAASSALGVGPVPGAMLGGASAQILDSFHRHPALPPLEERHTFRVPMPEPVSTPRIEEPDLIRQPPAADSKDALRRLPSLGATPTTQAATRRPVLRILVDQPDSDANTSEHGRSE